MGTFRIVGNAAKNGANPVLVAILRSAAAKSPYNVELYSGNRPGDVRRHGKSIAVDIRLIDPQTNRVLPNYQNARHFRPYEEFAQTARGEQMRLHPEVKNNFAWGGYFSGPPGEYGALDLMHFDLGGQMAGGTWEGGLTREQAALWPGITSVGMRGMAAAPTTPTRGAYPGSTAAAATAPANPANSSGYAAPIPTTPRGPTPPTFPPSDPFAPLVAAAPTPAPPTLTPTQNLGAALSQIAKNLSSSLEATAPTPAPTITPPAPPSPPPPDDRKSPLASLLAAIIGGPIV